MKNEAKDAMLTEAKDKLFAAREAFFAAKTKKARREADAEIEFWGNKAAFLEHAR